MSVIEVKPMTAPKILRKIESEAPIYKNYESKKLSIEIESDEFSNIFSGQFKIKRNHCIILTVKKLSVPLGRVKLTPDSIVFINFFDKSFIAEEISQLKIPFGIQIDYNLIQSVLTGDVLSFMNDNIFNKELLATIDSQQYRIETLLNSRIENALEAENKRKWERFKKNLPENEFITHTLWVDPQYFVIKKVIRKNLKSEEIVTINFEEYELIGRSLFPQYFILDYLSKTNKMKVEMRLSKSSVNSDKDFTFSIPNSYTKNNVFHLQ